MQCLNRFEPGLQPVQSHLSPRVSFLDRQASDVSYQLLYIDGFDLGGKRRHFPSALGDYFSECGVALVSDFVGSQILRMERLAGSGVAAAVGSVAQVTVCLINVGGRHFGPRYTY